MKEQFFAENQIVVQEPALSSKIAEAEARANESLAEERQARSLTHRPQGLERLFGQPGQPQRYLAPQHLLHTLPPDYPLSMAISFLLSFIRELEVHLLEGKEKKATLEKIINEHFQPLTELKNQYLALRSQHDKSLLKFRYRTKLTGLTQHIFATLNHIREKDSLPPQDGCPALAIENFLRNIKLSLRNSREQIDTISTDLEHYQLRSIELIEQYFQELEQIPQAQLQSYLKSSGQAALHARILKAKDYLDLPVPL